MIILKILGFLLGLVLIGGAFVLVAFIAGAPFLSLSGEAEKAEISRYGRFRGFAYPVLWLAAAGSACVGAWKALPIGWKMFVLLWNSAGKVEIWAMLKESIPQVALANIHIPLLLAGVAFIARVLTIRNYKKAIEAFVILVVAADVSFFVELLATSIVFVPSIAGGIIAFMSFGMVKEAAEDAVKDERVTLPGGTVLTRTGGGIWGRWKDSNGNTYHQDGNRFVQD